MQPFCWIEFSQSWASTTFTPLYSIASLMTRWNHQTAKRTISKYIASNHRRCTYILAFATFAYKAAVHNTSQMSPFFTLFLWESTTPVDLTLPIFLLPIVAAKFHSQIEIEKWRYKHESKINKTTLYTLINFIVMNRSPEMVQCSCITQ